MKKKRGKKQWERRATASGVEEYNSVDEISNRKFGVNHEIDLLHSI